MEKCDIGLIGLGVMGRNLALNMADHGYSVAVYNRTRDKTDAFLKEEGEERGIRPGYTVEEFVDLLRPPRSIILMVTAGAPVDAVIKEFAPRLNKGDLLADGGNSRFIDTDRRAGTLSAGGLLYLGMGISGGELGARFGPSMMPGGPKEGWERIRPILEATAAKVNGEPCVAYLGKGSAGHYVKMAHNGIEYGMMQAYAEGFSIMRAKTEFGLDLAKISEIWRYGSVVRSWLLDLTARALEADPTLSDLEPWVEDSGEGRWTVAEAMDHAVPAPVITLALQMRFASRDRENFTARLLAAMRHQFGGHAVKKVQ